jgi:hypothetical protein
MFKKIIQVLVILGISILSWGCSSNFVSTAIVREGIGLYLTQTQTELSTSLHLPPPDFQVQRVNIDEQRVFLHDRLPTYHVQGHYNLRLKFLRQTIVQQDNPFDLYLQQQSEGKSWRLLLPSGTQGKAAQLWQSFLLEEKVLKAS